MNNRPRSIDITGSTRGIGYSLAAAFLEPGCAVTVSGRTQGSSGEAVTKLGVKYGSELIYAFPCDVTDSHQVLRLWENARDY